MKPNHIFSIFVILIGLAACKKESGNVQQEPAQDTTQVATTPGSAATAEPAAPATQSGTTNPTISGGHDYTFLTDKLFHYKAAFGGTSTDKQLYKDEWIDLASDGTYKAGKLKQQTHTGKWDYNNDLKILQLRPDSKSFLMSEWKVMHNEQMMVWVGTQTYGNQSTQVQLVRSSELPQ